MDVGAKAVQVDALVGDSDLVEQARHRVRIAQPDGEDQHHDRFLHRLGKPPDQSEIEEAEPVPRQDDDVPGMRVAMEDPLDEELLEALVEDAAGEELAIDVGRRRAFEDRLELEAAQLFERQDGPAGMGPVGARDDHVLAAVLAELLDVPRLVLEIELEEHRLLELGDDAGRRVDAGFLDDAFEEAGQIGKQIGVAADLHFDAGPLHLDHHLLAGRKPGAMHLGDGRGCERLRIDLGEQLAPGLLQPLLDEAQDLLEREGRRAVLQGRKLGDEIGRNHVRARGEDLAELDEGRSQLGERVAKPARARRPKLRRRRTLGDLAPPERFPEPRAVEQLPEAVLDDDLADLAQPL